MNLDPKAAVKMNSHKTQPGWGRNRSQPSSWVMEGIENGQVWLVPSGFLLIPLLCLRLSTFLPSPSPSPSH